jgi:2-dehydro-3-deoxygluconokinase
VSDYQSTAVASIGEGQLRLVAPTGVPLVQAEDLQVYVAGTEGNVLGLLSRLGNPARLITALPDTPLGRRVAEEYIQAGIDVSRIAWRSEGRVALYFVEQGSPPVPSRVLYDRANSCFSAVTVTDIDWIYLQQAKMVHLSGITAALGDNLYEVVLSAAQQARSSGQLLSVDVNYRSLLWDPPTARQRLEPVVTGADVLFCSRRDAAAVFGVNTRPAEVAKELANRFSARTVIVSDGRRPIEVFTNGDRYSASPPTTTVIDRVGAGDALIGGFLHGVLRDDIELGLRLGVAAAALALTRHGDQLHTSLEELLWLSSGISGDRDIIR